MASRTKKKKPRLPPYVVIKNGSEWHVRLGLPTKLRDAKGKIVYEQYTRKVEPKTWERAAEIVAFLKTQLRSEPAISETNPTLNEFLTEYLKSKAKSVEPRTVQYYEYLQRKFVEKSAFGASDITKIDSRAVQRFYDNLTASPAMVKKLDVLLSMAFKQAVRWGTIEKNPCEGIMLPKVIPTETQAMTKLEARAFSKAIQKDDRFIIFELALETGLRPQEVIGLGWADVDLVRRKIRVRQAVKQDLGGGNRRIGKLKTKASTGTIGFSEYLKGRLLRQREIIEADVAVAREKSRQRLLLAHKRATGTNYKKRRTSKHVAVDALQSFEQYDLVFPSQNGRPRSLTNISRRDFSAAAKLAGLPAGKYSFRSLRHTCLTIAAEHLNPKKLQKFARHSDISTTYKYYVHVHDDSQFEGTDAMAAALYT